MADILWFDGRFTDSAEPVLTVQDRGLLFGDAVYEVLKIVDRAPILVDAHWRRLCRSLELVEIGNPWTAESFRDVLASVVARSGLESGIVYLQVSRGGGQRAHAWADDLRPVAFVQSSAFRFPDEATRRDGVAVITMPESRWARCEIKSVNLLPNVLAKKAAKRAGAWEAVFVENERIIEGSSSNVFAVLDGRVVTHPVGPGMLRGTVRDAVIELARSQGLAVDESPLRLSDLERASEAFLTSTTNAVLPIASVDGRPCSAARGQVTERLQRAFAGLERDEAAAWHRNPRRDPAA